MKWLLLFCLLGIAWGPGVADAQLQLPGQARNISVIWRNTGGRIFENEIRARMLQATSATAVSLDEQPWKELRVLPGQTILESASFDFPFVRAETKFLVQWIDAANHIIGTTEVWVYPTNVLHELKLLVDESWNNLGVLDPQNQLKPALRGAALPFVNLEEASLAAFSGKLAVVGSCSPDDPEWSGLAEGIRALAQKGTPVVWIQGPPRQQNKIRPSFYVVPQNKAAVVVVQPGLIADLPENPRSQLNLIEFCRMALRPENPSLPNQTR
jgi:hypothetical protein